MVTDRNREILFSNIGKNRAQSAGHIRSNPKDIVLDQIKSSKLESND